MEIDSCVYICRKDYMSIRKQLFLPSNPPKAAVSMKTEMNPEIKEFYDHNMKDSHGNSYDSLKYSRNEREVTQKNEGQRMKDKEKECCGKEREPQHVEGYERER